MNLYLIKTQYGIYATNAEYEREAIDKFEDEYISYEIDSVEKIPVENLVTLEGNDDIIFF